MDFDFEDPGARIKDTSDTENGASKGITASPASDEKMGK